MTYRRILDGAVPSSPPPPLHHVDSDFIVILAALLCALICVLGLVAIVRCAWTRRSGGSNTTQSSSSSSAIIVINNKGLKKKALNSLPKLTYAPPSAASAGKFSGDCAICLAEYAAGDEIRLLPQCGHVFHVGCVDTWLKSHSSCPSCRQHILAPRCQKCGELPASSSAAVTASSRQDEVGIFLP